MAPAKPMGNLRRLPSPVRTTEKEAADLLHSATQAFADGDYQRAVGLCDRAVHGGGQAHYRAALLRGQSLLLCGDPAGALNSYESIADARRIDPLVDLARGLALFELLRFAEAEAALCSALQEDSSLAEAYYVRALMAEMMATGAEQELWREARRCAPDQYPAVLHRRRLEFEEIIDEARQGLEPAVLELVLSVPLLICDCANVEDLRCTTPPTSPHALSMLGRSDDSEPRLLLFKKTLERSFRPREALIAALRQHIFNPLAQRLSGGHG